MKHIIDCQVNNYIFQTFNSSSMYWLDHMLTTLQLQTTDSTRIHKQCFYSWSGATPSEYAILYTKGIPFRDPHHSPMIIPFFIYIATWLFRMVLYGKELHYLLLCKYQTKKVHRLTDWCCFSTPTSEEKLRRSWREAS